MSLVFNNEHSFEPISTKNRRGAVPRYTNEINEFCIRKLPSYRPLRKRYFYADVIVSHKNERLVII